MKILWITHRRLDSDFSSQSRHGIAKALTDFGWDVEWLAASGGHYSAHRSKILGLGHHSFTKSIKRSLQEIQLKQYDVALVEWTAVIGSVEALKNADIPWVLVDRSPPVSTGLVQWIQNLQYKEAWNIARIFAAGCAVKSQFLAESQLWERPIAIVPAGVNLDDFSPTIMTENPTIVSHGVLAKERCLEKLWRIDNDIRFIGAGSAAKSLKRKGVKVEGPYNSIKLKEKLAECEIGVLHLPNREVWKHASPLKVAEFAASGFVIVSSDVSGLNKFRDEEWIRIIPLGDDDACKKALNEFKLMPVEERQRLGALARAAAEKSMTWKHCCNDLHDLLIEVKC
ncbi:MAG: hypothetical protein QF440_06120 [Candidatus Thalassarchaeaceae archaeon]|jgi:glycosyltransferase involved in cell wall biosynthesis|nr:hypothetical protein [Candidatus Thalassarchaeaceae archaeon]